MILASTTPVLVAWVCIEFYIGLYPGLQPPRCWRPAWVHVANTQTQRCTIQVATVYVNSILMKEEMASPFIWLLILPLYCIEVRHNIYTQAFHNILKHMQNNSACYHVVNSSMEIIDIQVCLSSVTWVISISVPKVLVVVVLSIVLLAFGLLPLPLMVTMSNQHVHYEPDNTQS